MNLPKLTVRLGRRGTALAVAGLLVLAGLCAVVVTTGVGRAEVGPLVGVAVPAADLKALVEAARSCPALTPARLAGQVMEESSFAPSSTSARNGSGVAGLRDAEWKAWQPWTGAVRADHRASIVGLAHQICDLVGQVRVAKVSGDTWRLAVGAFYSDLVAVKVAQGVPQEARDYVDRVVGYAAWYAQQPEFGGTGTGSSPSGDALTLALAVVGVSDAYLPSVLAAGQVCAAVSPARVAGQLMAASDFTSDRLGSNGAQGIAQFTPQMWARYAPSATASPWDPTVAIPALGRAMCDLIQQVKAIPGDPYQLALAAFQGGIDAVQQAGGVPTAYDVRAFIVAVLSYAEVYARDPRLAVTVGPTSTPAPTLSRSAGPIVLGVTKYPAAPKTSAPAQTAAPALTSGALFNDEFHGCLSAVKALDGTHLAMAACDGSLVQRWQAMADGTIRSVGLCMDVANASTADFAPVQVAVCSGNPAQLFTLNQAQHLFSSYADKCVNVHFTAAAGTSIVVYQCVNQTNQIWRFQKQ